MKRFLNHFRYGQKGFTLIELLVVIGILGAIAAVVVPNVGSFIGRGKTEAQATELHNIQTSVMAILVDSTSGQLDDTAGCVNVDPATAIATDDMSLVKTAGSPQFFLSDYLTGLDGTLVKSDCTYKFGTDGTVIQVLPGTTTP
ncbi:hypothetical protein ES704_03983 [subsurface metagenome]|jgi:prepilin-type N-terminal cleavage/methylation domain-containing protein